MWQKVTCELSIFTFYFSFFFLVPGVQVVVQLILSLLLLFFFSALNFLRSCATI